MLYINELQLEKTLILISQLWSSLLLDYEAWNCLVVILACFFPNSNLDGQLLQSGLICLHLW